MIIPSIVSDDELLQALAKGLERLKERSAKFSAKVKASGNDPNFFKDLTVASRAGEISKIDKIRRRHYGNVPVEDLEGALMHKLVAYVRDELSDEEASKTFGRFFDGIKVLKECAVAYGIHEMDKAVLYHAMTLGPGMLKMCGCDIEALESECDGLGYLWANATPDTPSPPRLANEPPPATAVVEIADASVKKLAGATGAAVKNAIKPGRGVKNVQYPEKTKWQCQSIWERCRVKEEVKRLAAGRKVSYDDVFKYAKAELARLEPVNITSAGQFRCVFGAKSDKEYAERKKDYDEKRQAVCSSQNNFLSNKSKCRP